MPSSSSSTSSAFGGSISASRSSSSTSRRCSWRSGPASTSTGRYGNGSGSRSFPASSGFRSSSRLWGGGSSLDGVGVLACLITALAYAAYVLMAERSLEQGRDVYSLLAWGFTFAALFWAVVQPWWLFPGGDRGRERLASRPLRRRHGARVAPACLHRRAEAVVPFIFLVSALHHVPDPRDHRRHEPVLAAIVAWVWLGEGSPRCRSSAA